jgi:hypothetical protein
MTGQLRHRPGDGAEVGEEIQGAGGAPAKVNNSQLEWNML